MNKSCGLLVGGGAVVIIAVAAVLFFTLNWGQSSSNEDKNIIHSPGGQYPLIESVEELVESADIVVEVVVKSVAAEEITTSTEFDDSEITTVSQIEVSSVFKGDVSSSEGLEVYQSGGETEETIFEVEGEHYLEEGKSYVLFLNSYGYLVHPVKAQYVIGENNELEPIEGNDLVLTRDDLDRLQ